jgi:hypothetical protein
MEAQRRSGHVEISSSIVLDATVRRAPDPAKAVERLDAAWPADGSAGPTPTIEHAVPADMDVRLDEMANRRYETGHSLCRVLLAEDGEPHVCVAAHHSILDGLGLIAVLGTALGERLGTTARGIDPALPVRSFGPGYAFRRLLEAVAAPPARIAPDRIAAEPGDHLVRLDLPASRFTTAQLLVAVAGAVRRWNAGSGRRRGRLVVAVGASRRADASPAIGPGSAWFRLGLDDPRPEVIEERFRAERPEPARGSALVGAAPSALSARLLARRLGSTLLVSNLARMDPSGSVRAGAFFPAAHGRSGIALGCLTTPGRTVLTLRARRSDYTREGAGRLVAMVAGALMAEPRRP